MRVRTQRGEVPIDQLLVGDMVWATDVRTGQSALKPVLHAAAGAEKEVLTVRLNGEAVAVTPAHLFRTDKDRWVEAQQLKPGDVVIAANGQARVERIEGPKRSQTAQVVVEDWHTLHLGRQGVLVRDTPLPMQSPPPAAAADK